MKQFFEVSHRSKKSKARLGTIHTSHGDVQTPAFVPVGTKGTIKALPQPFFKDIGIQLSFVNTYHLVTHPGVEVLQTAGGIHNFAKYNIPLMSDSGGFQVFSLAQRERTSSVIPRDPSTSVGMTKMRKANVRGDEEPLVLKIDEDGVKFRSVYDGQTIGFTPEKSMEYQKIIGADLVMAFDECTYYPATHEYAEKAMRRTHEWLKRCIEYKRNNFITIDSVSHVFPASALPPKAGSARVGNPDMTAIYREYSQYLYGIIQGGTYEDLRIASAKFINEQDVPGVAIGGVSVGESKEEMRSQVAWIAPYLPANKPVHLLGVGHVDDIIDLVTYGIDTFDCVEPTRLARMGTIYQSQITNNKSTNQIQNLKSSITQIDINKSIYKADLSPVDEGCNCYVCQNYSKSYLYHLFKQKEILGYILATYHNLYVMEKLMEKVRLLITIGKM